MVNFSLFRGGKFVNLDAEKLSGLLTYARKVEKFCKKIGKNLFPPLRADFYDQNAGAFFGFW